jgi:hypothetical protein
MGGRIEISGRVVAAARALSGVSLEDFAHAAGLTVEGLNAIEASGSAWIRSDEDIDRVNRALEHFGVITIGELDGMGAGDADAEVLARPDVHVPPSFFTERPSVLRCLRRPETRAA